MPEISGDDPVVDEVGLLYRVDGPECGIETSVRQDCRILVVILNAIAGMTRNDRKVAPCFTVVGRKHGSGHVLTSSGAFRHTGLEWIHPTIGCEDHQSPHGVAGRHCDEQSVTPSHGAWS